MDLRFSISCIIIACGSLKSLIVMKSLKNAPDYWEVDKVNSELKIHTLQEELERTQLQCRRLQEKSQVKFFFVFFLSSRVKS